MALKSAVEGSVTPVTPIEVWPSPCGDSWAGMERSVLAGMDGHGPSMEQGSTYAALQYRIELDGVMICFSHMALRWKNQSQ